jgi:energy-coupling factor transporter ATP-binding protein EcfA2
MDFVGRKREIAAVIRSLKQGRNVVLTGRFGVGRSRLVKHISKLYPDAWQFLFADFSKPASRSCNDLIHQLVPHRNRSRRNCYTRLMYAKDFILGKKLAAHLPGVVVLDNIGKISNQKLAFIRDMRFDSELLFIAIGESFLSEAELFRLRSVLYPSDVLTLHNLSKTETKAFYRNASQKKRLDWDESFIKMLAASTEGYPLLMKERIQREAGPSIKTNKKPKWGRM